jgi:dihydrofolate reductase
MGKVIVDVSMSLDGFMTASGQTAEEPMGEGGLRLMEWAMGPDERGRELLEGWVSGLGASIAGRTTYDTSLEWWGADGPSGSDRRPVFVVTHTAPEESPENGVYTFVTEGIEHALDQAQAVAGERDVTVMGGANLTGQYLAAGLVDEIQVHIVPVLFGRGTRMFEDIGADHLSLAPTEVVETTDALHVRYRIGEP